MAAAQPNQPACSQTAPGQVQANSWPRVRHRLAPRGAQSIELCRYSGLNSHPASALAGSDYITNHRTIDRLVRRFDALKRMPRGVFCPADDGSQVLATLFYAGHQVTISTRLTGCQLVSNGEIERTAADFKNRNPAGPKLVSELERLTQSS
jgi:hypothetical protein